MRLLFEVKNSIWGITLFCVFLAGCKKAVVKAEVALKASAGEVQLPYYKDASFTPYWFTPNSVEAHGFHRIPNFSLVNQLGDTISQDTFDNKIYITDFFFTSCPGICLKMTSNMLELQEQFANDHEVLLLSHSVTPSLDTVPVLKKYADKNGIMTNKWHLVTGDRSQIYDLGRRHYFVENDMGIPKDTTDFLHTENFLLIDKQKHIRGIYNGLNRASMAQLIADIEVLKKK